MGVQPARTRDAATRSGGRWRAKWRMAGGAGRAGLSRLFLFLFIFLLLSEAREVELTQHGEKEKDNEERERVGRGARMKKGGPESALEGIEMRASGPRSQMQPEAVALRG